MAPWPNSLLAREGVGVLEATNRVHDGSRGRELNLSDGLVLCVGAGSSLTVVVEAPDV